MRPRKNIPRALHEGGAAGERFNRPGMGGARAPHSPEHNLIQRPDILRDIRDFLQLKQMHITPALAENVQAVLVIDDLSRRQVPSRRQRTAASVAPIGGDGLTLTGCFGLRNPLAARTRVHLTRILGLMRGGGPLARLNCATADDLPLPVGMTAIQPFDRHLVRSFPAIPGGTVQFMIGYGGALGFDMAPVFGGVDYTPFNLDTDIWCDPGVWPVFACTTISAADGFYLSGMEWEEEVVT